MIREQEILVDIRYIFFFHLIDLPQSIYCRGLDDRYARMCQVYASTPGSAT